MEAHPRAMEAHLGAMETPPGVIEDHPGAIKANPGGAEADLVMVLDVPTELLSLIHDVQPFSMGPPLGLLTIWPLLVHGPQVVLMQDNWQHLHLLCDVKGP